MDPKTITRREMLGKIALVGLSVAGAGVLGACSSGAQEASQAESAEEPSSSQTTSESATEDAAALRSPLISTRLTPGLRDWLYSALCHAATPDA